MAQRKGRHLSLGEVGQRRHTVSGNRVFPGQGQRHEQKHKAWEIKFERLVRRVGSLDLSNVQSFHVKDRVLALSQGRFHYYA